VPWLLAGERPARPVGCRGNGAVASRRPAGILMTGNGPAATLSAVESSCRAGGLLVVEIRWWILFSGSVGRAMRKPFR
jgi:hypothetical protein